MDRKKQKKIQIAASIIAVAMTGSLFAGILQGKANTELPIEEEPAVDERVLYEDGFKEYKLGDVIEVENGYLAAIVTKEWVQDIPLSGENKEKRITAEEGTGFLVFRGAFQKEYPGLMNLYEEMSDVVILFNNTEYDAEITVGEKADEIAPYSLNTYEEIPLYFYVELNSELKDAALKEAGFEVTVSDGSFQEEEDSPEVQKYRYTESTGK